jgi:ABC-type transporter lipoprotein component MlaA
LTTNRLTSPPLAKTASVRKISRIIAVGQIFLALTGAAADTNTHAVFGENAIILPEPIPDRIEPVNRVLWKFNQAVLRTVIQPSSRVYRAAVPREVRKGITNVGRNLFYPRNVVNNLFQQNWAGARDETYRFLLNSSGGLGGLFDVATPSGIRAAEADFGQTLRNWGWQPQVYLMVPITGPSNERDLTGGLLDRFLYPLTYVSSPWSYSSLGIVYNNLTDTVDDYVRTTRAEYDPYSVLRYAWSINREHRPAPLPMPADHDIPSLETLQSVFFRIRDPQFPREGKTRTIEMPGTGKELPYTVWMQRTEAPLVLMVPGFASHRLSGGAIALAEVLYNAGFSVANVSSTFNHEFMERAASHPLPGYTPEDARDLHVALTEVNMQIEQQFPGRVTSRSLVGYSMGGFYSLFLAGAGETNDLVSFDRFVAIDPPVRLLHGIERLDDHFASALNWPAAERTDRIEATFHKVAALARNLDSLSAESKIPLDSNESRFLVGLAFRISLRDIIFLSQVQTNQGILREDLNIWRRDPVYREILQYTFADYLEKFVIPYYLPHGVDLRETETVAKATSLTAYEEQLRGNGKVRVVANANDILLAPEDAQWLREMFGGHLTLFERGGHLGNLNDTIVQHAIVQALADLRPPL